MASWLVGAPGERQNSRLQRQYIQERIEARPKLATPATIEEISAPLMPKAKTATTSATQTKLNPSAIKSRIHTNEQSRSVFIC